MIAVCVIILDFLNLCSPSCQSRTTSINPMVSGGDWGCTLNVSSFCAVLTVIFPTLSLLFSVLVGSNVTNSTFRTANNKDFKSINNYKLYEIMPAVITGSNGPATSDVLKQLAQVLTFQFNFQKKVHGNTKLS